MAKDSTRRVVLPTQENAKPSVSTSSSAELNQTALERLSQERPPETPPAPPSGQQAQSASRNMPTAPTHYGDDPEAAAEALYGERRTYSRNQRLPSVPARNGFAQRWVQYQFEGGASRLVNVSLKRDQGWLPRHPDTMPAAFRASMQSLPVYGDVIMVLGHVLCEMPESYAKSRRKEQQDATKQRTDSVDSLLRTAAANDGLPIMNESRREIHRGSGKPMVADD